MNLRPPGYEPDELPGCSTPRYSLDCLINIAHFSMAVKPSLAENLRRASTAVVSPCISPLFMVIYKIMIPKRSHRCEDLSICRRLSGNRKYSVILIFKVGGRREMVDLFEFIDWAEWIATMEALIEKAKA